MHLSAGLLFLHVKAIIYFPDQTLIYSSSDFCFLRYFFFSSNVSVLFYLHTIPADLLEVVFCGCEEIQLERLVSIFITHFKLEKSALTS